MNSLRPQFAETISRIGDTDSDLFVVVGDISHGILAGYRENHPERYRNIGICEPAMISLSAGLNAAGFNPVVHTIAPFLIERSFEQIKLDFGYQQLDCNLISVGSSFDYAKLGCSHHSYIDVALIASIEDSQVFVPGSNDEFDSLFTNNYQTRGIKYYRLTENGHGFDGLTSKPTAGQNTVVRQGTDLTIVALGPSLRIAMLVADLLEKESVSAEVIYVHTFKPFDSDSVLKSVGKTSNLIVISELSVTGGLGALCLEAVSGKTLFNYLNFEIDKFIRGYGELEDLQGRANHSPQHIFLKIITTFEFRKHDAT
jgi:transketolase